ncbi:iojap-like protein [Dictyocaulus viviparus]|uniref:Iojap-like protein n=1 Tax=Dictyocaulus viviparus TaxID=29172 RepID=A0A0D8X7M1_DICVI|nr:iojap-like protein [Dictyocaulus viviparus]
MIVNVIDQNKGHDIVTFDVQNKTVIAKYMIVASGNSNRHVKALAEHVIKNLKRYDKAEVEGIDESNWVIMNFQGIVVHIFRPEAYDFVELNKKYGCRLQIRGSDQWGNIVNGIELGKKLNLPELFGLTAPLLLNA